MANWSKDKKTRESIPKKVSNSKRLIQFSTMGLLLLISLTMVFPSAMAALQVNVTVNSGSKIGTNYFSPGFVLDFEWKFWRDNTISRQLSADANFDIMRICSSRIEPCTSWSDSSRSGSFNWANVDSLVQRLYGIGIQPLITLGFCDYNGFVLPPGMKLNPTTGLPYAESFAAYCREWVKHFKTVGYPVKYYEIINEAWYYFYPSWTWYETKANNFLQLFNTCYDAMHTENSNVMIGNDASLFTKFLNYWKTHGGKLDVFTFHKYDSWGISYPDSQGLDSAERKYFDPSYDSLRFTIPQARQFWGARLPVIATESNWGASQRDGTDPRLQKLIGAVWAALVLRGCILNGVDYLCYYTFASSKSSAISRLPQGYGFGMINKDNNQPWYPYYVLKMVGANLAVGDSIVASSSSSSLIRTLAWTHQGKTNLLVISKTSDTTTVNVQGFQGKIAFQKIDNTISWETPSVQSGSIDASTPITLKGYSVLLVQKESTALTVTAPNGGQSWVRGTAHTITWTSSGSPGANVKIELLKGGVLNRVISSSTANDGSYGWTISSTQTLGTDYKIRITSTSITSITDSSDSNFAIS